MAGELLDAARAVLGQYSAAAIRELLHEPLFIVSAPRAGSTLLFEALMPVAGFWTIGGESHGVFRAFPGLRAEDAEPTSGALDRRHADAETARLLPACFVALLLDHRRRPFMAVPAERRPARVTLLEKTPRNALNIGFLLEIFPDARFVYLQRDPRENIASLIEAWTAGLGSGRFVTFRDLPAWDRNGWCFLLPRGWQRMIGKSLPEIAAFQWAASNDAIIESLETLPADRYAVTDYGQLVASPADTLGTLCRFAGVQPQRLPGGPLPLSRTSLTPPHSDKWRKHEREIVSLLPDVGPTWRRMQAFR